MTSTKHFSNTCPGYARNIGYGQDLKERVDFIDSLFPDAVRIRDQGCGVSMPMMIFPACGGPFCPYLHMLDRVTLWDDDSPAALKESEESGIGLPGYLVVGTGERAKGESLLKNTYMPRGEHLGKARSRYVFST